MIDYGLLIIERFILESLSKKAKNIADLSKDTQLKENIIKNILESLKGKQLVIEENDIFSLNIEQLSKCQKSNNIENLISSEFRELMDNFIKNHFSKKLDHKNMIFNKNDNELKIKKLWLTDEEEVVLYSLLRKLETFVEGVLSEQKKRSQLYPISKQKVLTWGHATYSDLIKESLNGMS